jgi:hypothetical protein
MVWIFRESDSPMNHILMAHLQTLYPLLDFGSPPGRHIDVSAFCRSMLLLN